MPFTCLNLQFYEKHSPLRSELIHISGWKSLHFLPRLQPRGCLVPCWVNLLHILGWVNLHSFPFIPCLQEPLL